jgi:hypothetical protein
MGMYSDWVTRNPEASDKQAVNVEFVLKIMEEKFGMGYYDDYIQQYGQGSEKRIANVEFVLKTFDTIQFSPTTPPTTTPTLIAELTGFATQELTLEAGWYKVVLAGGGGGGGNLSSSSKIGQAGGFLDHLFFFPFPFQAKLMSGEGGKKGEGRSGGSNSWVYTSGSGGGGSVLHIFENGNGLEPIFIAGGGNGESLNNQSASGGGYGSGAGGFVVGQGPAQLPPVPVNGGNGGGEVFPNKHAIFGSINVSGQNNINSVVGGGASGGVANSNGSNGYARLYKF